MPLHRIIFSALAAVILASTPAAARSKALGAPGETLLSATELALPKYQQDVLAADADAPDILFDHDGSLWVVGQTSLWRWRTDERKLARMRLHDPKSDNSPLSRVASDGVNLFASSRATVYQVVRGEDRVFRYPASPATAAAPTPFFAGVGDDFWWVAGGAMHKLDRYGKKLIPRGSAAFLGKASHVAALAGSDAFVWTEGKRLLKAKASDATTARVIFTAKNPLLDVQAAAGHLIAHTAHTVVRLSQGGAVLQAIPVEGRRSLVRMAISPERHAYLFDDHLLEVYDLQTKTASRYALPLESPAAVQHLALSGSLAAVVEAGVVRVFRLSAKSSH